jgi:hypothetical protein
MLSLWFCFLIFINSLVSARLANVTVDDVSPIITYSPANGWDLGPSCQSCTATAHIDKGQVLNQTWHDGTSNRNIDDSGNSLRTASLTFNGTEVYVFCILANTRDAPNGFSEMYFLIDGQVAGTFSHTPSNGAPQFIYNVPVFVANSLSPGLHSLTIQNGQVGGPKSLVLFDYLVYSYDDGSPDSSPSSDPPSSSSATQSSPQATASDCTGRIVGAVLGTIAGVLLVLVGVLWYRQRTSNAPVLPTMVQKETTTATATEPKAPTTWFASIVKPTRHVKSSSTVHATNASSFSFNPSMLVRPMINRSRTLLFRPPPAIVTVEPMRTNEMEQNRPDSLRPLHPNRTPSPSPSNMDPRTAPLQPMSIEQWQQRTRREAHDMPPRLSVSEVDLSSYWEMSSSAEPQPMRPPQRPAPMRRFTVVNN